MDGASIGGKPDELGEVPKGEEEGHAHTAEGEEVHDLGVLQLPASEPVDEESEEGQKGDQPKQRAWLGGGVRQSHLSSHGRRHPFSRLMSSTWTVSRLR